MGTNSGMGGSHPFLVVLGFCVLSSGFWSSGLFSGPGFRRRTSGISEPEQLTLRKSKRPIEGFVCMPMLSLCLIGECLPWIDVLSA